LFHPFSRFTQYLAVFFEKNSKDICSNRGYLKIFGHFFIAWAFLKIAKIKISYEIKITCSKNTYKVLKTLQET
jgi:hypothetical protein